MPSARMPWPRCQALRELALLTLKNVSGPSNAYPSPARTCSTQMTSALVVLRRTSVVMAQPPSGSGP
jgi:hypothetical protein